MKSTFISRNCSMAQRISRLVLLALSVAAVDRRVVESFGIHPSIRSTHRIRPQRVRPFWKPTVYNARQRCTRSLSSLSNDARCRFFSYPTEATRVSTSRLHSSQRLDIALDRPLPIPQLWQGQHARNPFLWTTTVGSMTWKLIRPAALVLVLFFVYQRYRSMASDVDSDGSYEASDVFSELTRWLEPIVSSVQRFVTEMAHSVSPHTVDVAPLPLDDATGWGVCTLQSIQPYGDTSWDQYTLAFPHSHYVLPPLTWGQTLTIACYNAHDQAVQADFYPVRPPTTPGRRHSSGSFSILVPRAFLSDTDTPFPTTKDAAATAAVGEFDPWNEVRQAHVARALSRTMEIGDEIAIQPGPCRWNDPSDTTATTELVYVVVGTGIVPVLNQLPMVLESTIESVAVVWINPTVNDFDVTADRLETEWYNRYSQLSVTCVVVDCGRSMGNTPGVGNATTESITSLEWLSSHTEIQDSIPSFRRGTLAIVAGPSRDMQHCVAYLQNVKGYARKGIHVL